jgi:hypothetical protein
VRATADRRGMSSRVFMTKLKLDLPSSETSQLSSSLEEEKAIYLTIVRPESPLCACVRACSNACHAHRYFSLASTPASGAKKSSYKCTSSARRLPIVTWSLPRSWLEVPHHHTFNTSRALGVTHLMSAWLAGQQDGSTMRPCSANSGLPARRHS